jgi:hypothetical protein
MIRSARLLTAYLLTAAAVAGLFAMPTAARVNDRAIRGVRTGQRLEFGHDDHRYVAPDELRPISAATAFIGDARNETGNHVSATAEGSHATRAILATALVFPDDAFVRRLAPPGGPHTPRLASLAPPSGRAPPSFS